MLRARYLPIPLLAGFALAVIPALGADQTVTANCPTSSRRRP